MIDFTRYTFNRYKPNWHHYLIADRLEMLARGDIHRLAINMPPRHGKSELVSVRFPAWYLGNFPHKSIIATSYNADLAAEFGKKARNVVASIEFKQVFKQAKLSEESAAKLNWTLEDNIMNRPCPTCGSINWSKRAFGRAICKTCHALGEFAGSKTLGAYYGAGIGGGITGKGADVLIIDDPIKDRKDAQSVAMRKTLWDWYSSAAYQRLEESDCICICQTRWHEDDLTGKVLALDYNKEWHRLSLEAIAEQDEEFEIFNPDYIEILGTNIVHRKKGEALWPQKYSIAKLNEIKKTVGSYEFSAQYQQKPQPDSGGLFKRENFRYCELNDGIYSLYNQDKIIYYNEKDCLRFITCDLSIKESNNSDYTVICTWDLTKNNDLILKDVYRKQVDGSEHINLVWSVYHTQNPQEINIESTAYQSTLIQTAIKQGLPALELKADRDKITRAIPAAAKFEANKVYFLKTLYEIHTLENELTQFPNAKYDDFVDNCGYATVRATMLRKMIYIPNPEINNNVNDRKKMLNSLR